VGIIRDLRDWLGGSPKRDSNLTLTLADWVSYFNYGGAAYPFIANQTLGEKQEIPALTFEGYVQALYKTNGIIFACMLARMLLFSEARFQFRRRVNGRPGDLFGTPALDVLEHPWQNATTGDLLIRAIQDADLAGNFYAYRGPAVGPNGRKIRPAIRRMRPDWVTIVVGSQQDSNTPGWELDAEVAGYVYQPGGPPGGRDPIILMPEQVAHFAPVPDPAFRFRGMSWLTPVIREIMGDNAATTHKLKFFENGATPNMVVSLDPKITPEVFAIWKKKMEEDHTGLANAYKTLYLGGGAQATVIGANMRQIDFKVTQGAGETRIAAAAGVPPIIVGLSEGLQAATYSNYGQARRRFSDGTMRPLWRNFAGSMASVIDVPQGAELWYDDRDIPFLQEDLKDRAEVQQTQSVAIKSLVDAGFRPDSVVSAITSDDMSRLVHTGLYSVQLQEPGLGNPKLPTPVNSAPESDTPAEPSGDEPSAEPSPADAAAQGRALLEAHLEREDTPA